MKRNAGFTLIELIIVIVILGILAVVAAPKFINMQSDAKAAVVQGMNGTLSSAANLAHAKAILKGTDKSDSTLTWDDGTLVTMVAGYPAASLNGILAVTNLSGPATDGSADWNYGNPSSSSTKQGTTGLSLVLWPKNSAVTKADDAVNNKCYVQYNSATTGTSGTTTTYIAPTVTSVTTGC